MEYLLKELHCTTGIARADMLRVWMNLLPTVQAVLKDIIQRVVRHPIDLKGTSRTDAGVHAEGQVANFQTDCAIPVDRLRLAINSRCPPDIAIRSTLIVGYPGETDEAFQELHDFVAEFGFEREMVPVGVAPVGFPDPRGDGQMAHGGVI